MKNQPIYLIILFGLILLSGVFLITKNNTGPGFVEENIKFARDQIQLQVDQIERSGKILNPRSFENGKIKYAGREDWTNGFFPGTIWYMFELTGDSIWKTYAVKYTESLDSVKYLTSHHDVGFMIQCSFGNGLRFSGNNGYKDVIIEAAKSLSTRFRPTAGIIQSWNVVNRWQVELGWECPVIIDNMMNLELLFNATKFSGDSSFYKIAVSHANKTIENQYRPDFSCYHVVDYNLADGSVRNKHTAQGYAHESSWARGQAWGIYGFTVCYRETGDIKYLKQAQNAFDFVIRHKNLPSDFIPYWDFDAPEIPNEPRDVSSAAIIASALYELAMYENGEFYKDWADKVMNSLASPVYRANLGENGNFILKHSVGNKPRQSEIDVPINYADYYFLEALLRKRNMEN